MCKRAASLFTPGIWISSIYFHINQTGAIVWPVGITSPSLTESAFFAHLSEISIVHLPFSRTDSSNTSSSTGSSHYQKQKNTWLISLVFVDFDWGRTEREQNVLFNKRITFWNNISFIKLCKHQRRNIRDVTPSVQKKRCESYLNSLFTQSHVRTFIFNYYYILSLFTSTRTICSWRACSAHI